MSRYATVHWYHSDAPSSVHPDDRHLVALPKSIPPGQWPRFAPNREVFRVGAVGEWVELEYGAERLRIARDALRPVPAPAFDVGETVSVVRDGSSVEAVVRETRWHYKREVPYHLLTISGRKSGRRYFDAELTKLGSQGL